MYSTPIPVSSDELPTGVHEEPMSTEVNNPIWRLDLETNTVVFNDDENLTGFPNKEVEANYTEATKTPTVIRTRTLKSGLLSAIANKIDADFVGWHFGNSERETVHAIVCGAFYDSLTAKVIEDPLHYVMKQTNPRHFQFIFKLAEMQTRSGTADEREPLAVPAVCAVQGPKTVGTFCYVPNILRLTDAYYEVDADLWRRMIYAMEDSRGTLNTNHCLAQALEPFRDGGFTDEGGIIKFIWERYQNSESKLAHLARTAMLINVANAVTEDAARNYRDKVGIATANATIINSINTLLYKLS